MSSRPAVYWLLVAAAWVLAVGGAFTLYQSMPRGDFPASDKPLDLALLISGAEALGLALIMAAIAFLVRRAATTDANMSELFGLLRHRSLKDIGVQPGQTVTHKTRGTGVVTAVYPEEGEAMVRFQGAGESRTNLNLLSTDA